MLIKEEFVNETKGYRYGDGEWYEPYTDDKGELFRAMRREYGRCTSRVYMDVAMGDGTYDVRHIGWYFQKRVQYTDCNETYLRGVWVTFKA